MFNQITLIDYTKPLAERAKSRKSVGPYRRFPTMRNRGYHYNTPSTGTAFYLGGNGKMMDKHGSSLRLRVEVGDNGFTGDEGFTYWFPMIARLPHGRGFLAGATLGAGMLALVGGTVWTDEADAWRVANDKAENNANEDAYDRAREYAYDEEF